TDETAGPRYQAFFQALKDRYGIEPSDIQGFNDRRTAFGNWSTHSERNPAGISHGVDVAPDKHPEGARGTWGSVPIRDLAAEFGLDWLGKRQSARGPDEMHFQVSRNYLGVPYSGGGTQVAAAPPAAQTSPTQQSGGPT